MTSLKVLSSVQNVEHRKRDNCVTVELCDESPPDFEFDTNWLSDLAASVAKHDDAKSYFESTVQSDGKYQIDAELLELLSFSPSDCQAKPVSVAREVHVSGDVSLSSLAENHFLTSNTRDRDISDSNGCALTLSYSDCTLADLLKETANSSDKVASNQQKNVRNPGRVDDLAPFLDACCSSNENSCTGNVPHPSKNEEHSHRNLHSVDDLAALLDICCSSNENSSTGNVSHPTRNEERNSRNPHGVDDLAALLDICCSSIENSSTENVSHPSETDPVSNDDFDSGVGLEEFVQTEHDTQSNSDGADENVGNTQYECLSDDGLVPDVDLNLCVKKSEHVSPKTDNQVPSPSLFLADVDLDLDNSHKGDRAARAGIFIEEDSPSDLNAKRQSLFSVTISCQPVTDKSKSEKVKSIQRHLLRKYFPVSSKFYQIQKPIKGPFVDKSNSCMIEGRGRFFA